MDYGETHTSAKDAFAWFRRVLGLDQAVLKVFACKFWRRISLEHSIGGLMGMQIEPLRSRHGSFVVRLTAQFVHCV